MRKLQLEAAIWYLFTSPEFFEAAARECDGIVDFYTPSPMPRPEIKFGLYKEDVQKLKTRAQEFRRGAELARLGDYRFIDDIAGWITSDVRGMIESAPHGWMDLAHSPEFNGGRISRLEAYAGKIESALHNALFGAETFFHPNPNCPERSDDDDGFPGDDISKRYDGFVSHFKEPLSCALPDPLPEYVVDLSTACRTGDVVPWTGVWYPITGLDRHSLTFAIKGLRMQPVYRVLRTTEELKTADWMFPPPETVAVATVWHPVIALKE